jgi:hypothetical protein
LAVDEVIITVPVVTEQEGCCDTEIMGEAGALGMSWIVKLVAIETQLSLVLLALTLCVPELKS